MSKFAALLVYNRAMSCIIFKHNIFLAHNNSLQMSKFSTVQMCMYYRSAIGPHGNGDSRLLSRANSAPPGGPIKAGPPGSVHTWVAPPHPPIVRSIKWGGKSTTA